MKNYFKHSIVFAQAVLLCCLPISTFGQSAKATLWAIEEGGKCGYIDRTGKLVIGFKFDKCWSFSEGFATVTESETTRFINERGNYLTDQPLYSWYPAYFSEGFANVTVKNSQTGNLEQGLIDTTGRLSIIPNATQLRSFSEGMAAFERDGLFGYVNESMKVVVKPRYKFAGSFSEGVADVSDEKGKSFYIDKSGNTVLAKNGRAFSEGLASFEVKSPYFGSTFGFFDLRGEVVIGAKFDYVKYFYEGLCAVVKDGDENWGYIDKSGSFVISPRFDDVADFSEGYAGVAIDGKWGFIDRTGKVIVPFEFDSVNDFENGVARVYLGDTYRYIDVNGKPIWIPKTR